MLRTTTAYNFSFLISPDVSAPAALTSLLFNPPEPQYHKKKVFHDFPSFSRTCIFFLLIFCLLTLLPANCFFICPYCRKFNFQISFEYVFNYFYLFLFIYSIFFYLIKFCIFFLYIYIIFNFY